MNKAVKLLQDHKYFIAWTICYLFVLWAILYYIFGFCIFSAHQWHRLANAQLHGFVGFVFGACIFAALPIYISTSALIIRNKKPLITIPVPKLPRIVKQEKTPVAEPESKPEPDTKNETPELNENIPPEIRAAFINAKNHPLNIQIQNSPESDSATDTIDSFEPTLPLPADFDIPFDTNTTSTSIPTFTDFNFDTDNNQTTSAVTQHLNQTNTEYDIIADIILTKTHAIAVHDDPDFWVADNDNWFATGKTKPSPISAVKSVAEQNNVTPVLCLTETNIMDIDTLIPQWESDGIKIITDISEI